MAASETRVVTLRAPNARDAKDYECPMTPTTVRLVRVVTPNGRVHVVMTSLLDTIAFPAAAFAAWYHSRWRIDIYQTYNLHKSEVRYDFALARSALSLASSASSA